MGVKRREATGDRRQEDPFASPEPDLFVADLSPTHYALLNKYNVLDHALLVVTRANVDQDVPLDLADFEALATCMRDAPVIGFYNGGAEAGASQRHKHLQVVPLPLSPRGDVPMDGALDALPFQHARASFASLPTARDLEALYRKLLRETASENRPYNLLVAQGWMLLVPRSLATFEGIPVNSLAFAGALFVRSDAELALLERVGPMSVLRSVALAKDNP